MYTGNQNPFTGNGHVPEAPELLAENGAQEVSEGIIVRIDPDGTEIPVAVTKAIDDSNPDIIIFKLLK